jgi:Fe-S cluster assembly protein SufD
VSAGPTTVLDRLPRPTDPDAAPARRWLERHGFPTTRDEAWHYSPLPTILRALDATGPSPAIAGARKVPVEVPRLDGTTRIVLLDGHHAPERSDPRPAGIWIGPRSGLRHADPADPTDPADPADLGWPDPDHLLDAFHALNRSAADPLLVVVAPGAAPRLPLHVAHVVSPGGAGQLLQPRLVVVLGAGARLDLVETFDSDRSAVALTNATTDVLVGEHASLVHHRLQDDHRDAVHLGTTAVDLARGAEYRSTSLEIGAGIARHTLAVTLRGPGANVDLSGLHLPKGHQHHDTSVTVDHRSSHGASRQQFLGVIDDHARGSFTGHIRIRPDTVDNRAHQTNHNLVLSRTAQADSRPWLEILADDVACTHGATVGRLDEEALFYLRSRGIPATRSRQLLIDAFTAQIVDAVEPPALRVHLDRLIDRRHRPRAAT